MTPPEVRGIDGRDAILKDPDMRMRIKLANYFFPNCNFGKAFLDFRKLSRHPNSKLGYGRRAELLKYF